MSPGRNDPCHCGSGKKYKKCCMREDERLERRKREAENEALAHHPSTAPWVATPGRLAMDRAMEHAINVFARARSKVVSGDQETWAEAFYELLERIGVRRTLLSQEELVHRLVVYVYFGRYFGPAMQNLRLSFGATLRAEMRPIFESEFGVWRIEELSLKTAVCRRLKTPDDQEFEVDTFGMDMIDFSEVGVGSCFTAYRRRVEGNYVFLFPILLDIESGDAIDDVVLAGGWLDDESYELDLLLMLAGTDWDFTADPSGRQFEEYEDSGYWPYQPDPEAQLRHSLAAFARPFSVHYHWSPLRREPGPMISLLARAGPSISSESSPAQHEFEMMISGLRYGSVYDGKESREEIFSVFGLGPNGECSAALQKWSQTPLYALDLDWSNPEFAEALEEAEVDPLTKLAEVDFGRLDDEFLDAAERHRHWCRWVAFLPLVENLVTRKLYYYPTSADRVVHVNIVAGLGFVPRAFLDISLRDIGLDTGSLRRLSQALEVAEGALTSRHVAMCESKPTDLPGIGTGTAERVRQALRQGLLAFGGREPERPAALAHRETIVEIDEGLSDLEALFSTDA